MPPVPERISRVRWSYFLLISRHLAVRFLYYQPHQTADRHRIRMYDSERYDVGVLVWQVCATCELGCILKISINPEWQRRGYGRRLIRRAVRDCTTYHWTTTGQSPEAKAFFPVLAAELGHEFEERGGTCHHMRDTQPTAYSRRRHGPRPVLERSI